MSEPVIHPSRANRIAGGALYVLSALALLTVSTGYFQRPLPDEGVAAHIFQLSVVTFGTAFLVFVATANWQDRRAVRVLGISSAILAAAFAALYYLEHIFYVTRVH